MSDRQITTYQPDNSIRNGYLHLFREVTREVVESRWLAYQLFKRDAFSLYKQSLLGAAWLLLVPLLTVGTFILLRGSGIIEAGQQSAPYPLYAGLGVAVWQLFANGLTAGANALVAAGDMISRINFSRKSLIFGAMGRSVVSFVVLIAFVAVLAVGYALLGSPLELHYGALLAPLALLPIAALTLGLSFYMALLNGIVRDVGTILSMGLSFLMLLTPVLYEKPAQTGTVTSRMLSTLTDYNPLYYLVTAPRDLVLVGALREPAGFVVSTLLSLLLLVCSLVSFHLTETRIAERI